MTTQQEEQTDNQKGRRRIMAAENIASVTKRSLQGAAETTKKTVQSAAKATSNAAVKLSEQSLHGVSETTKKTAQTVGRGGSSAVRKTASVVRSSGDRLKKQLSRDPQKSPSDKEKRGEEKDGGTEDLEQRESLSAPSEEEQLNQEEADMMMLEEQSSLFSEKLDQDETTTAVVVLGPVLEFCTADASLFLIMALSFAIYPTYQQWDTLGKDGMVPVSVMVSWLIVAFAVGQAFGNSSSRWLMPFYSKEHALAGSAKQIMPSTSEEIDANQLQREAIRKNRHSLFFGLLGKRSDSVRFQQDQVFESRKRNAMGRLRRSANASFSSLNQQRRASMVLPWQRNIDPSREKQNRLVRFLVEFRRGRSRSPKSSPRERRDTAESAVSTEDSVSTATTTSTVQVPRMGNFDLNASVANSFDEQHFQPLLKLRGMDVFLSDNPESNVATHPWLLQQGLRDRPTFTVNVLTQWGNVLVYFEMPSWVNCFDVEVDEQDEDDVKAWKRFLNGNSDYKNARLKMIPSLAEGPRAMSLLAPPKKERLVHCETLPITWRQHGACIKDGRKLYPHLEATLDCMTNRAVRSLTCMVKRYLHALSVDVAVVIAKPEEQEESEPSACLGLWRFDHINIYECPTLPDRFAAEASSIGQSPDLIRASLALGLSPEEANELTSERQ